MLKLNAVAADPQAEGTVGGTILSVAELAGPIAAFSSRQRSPPSFSFRASCRSTRWARSSRTSVLYYRRGANRRAEEAPIPPVELSALRGPISVTALYFALWYALLFGLQTRTKYRLLREYAARGEVFDRYRSADPEMLKADRAVQNTHEQMVPFLIAMWMHALVVSPDAASALGAAYVVLRAIYPFLLGSRIERVQPRRVAFVTFPCYGLIFWMLGSSVLKVWAGGG